MVSISAPSGLKSVARAFMMLRGFPMQYVEGFDRNFGIAGRVAVITGAAQGIGRAIAELYAAEHEK